MTGDHQMNDHETKQLLELLRLHWLKPRPWWQRLLDDWSGKDKRIGAAMKRVKETLTLHEYVVATDGIDWRQKGSSRDHDLRIIEAVECNMAHLPGDCPRCGAQ